MRIVRLKNEFSPHDIGWFTGLSATYGCARRERQVLRRNKWLSAISSLIRSSKIGYTSDRIAKYKTHCNYAPGDQ